MIWGGTGRGRWSDWWDLSDESDGKLGSRGWSDLVKPSQTQSRSVKVSQGKGLVGRDGRSDVFEGWGFFENLE